MTLRSALVAFLDTRSRVVLGLIGIGLIWLGFHERRVGEGAGDEPIDVELSALEAGKLPASPYVRLGRGEYSYADLVYWTRDKSLPQERHDVEYALIPVRTLPVEEPGQEAAEPGPDSSPKVTVVVKTKRFRSVEKFPKQPEVFTSVEGVLVHKTEKLSSEELNLLAEISPHDIWVVDEGRKPWSSKAIWGSVLAGLAVLAVVGFASYAAWKPTRAEVELAKVAATSEPVDIIGLFWMSLLYGLAGMTMVAFVFAITTFEWCIIVAAAIPATPFNVIFWWSVFSAWFGKPNEYYFGLSRRPQLVFYGLTYAAGIATAIWISQGVPGLPPGPGGR